jgi:acetyltransferase-like isoleucine patch superfamily enzyme
MFFQFIKKYKFDIKTDRIGPDIPFTHWRLYFHKKMLALCIKKFKVFSETAQFRPGAYAIGCSKINIGNRVIIRAGCMLFGESKALSTSILIEDDVMMGCGVHFYINNHKFESSIIPLIDQGYYPDEPIILRQGCWIGANSILLPGVEIGENSVVGAGSVVTKSFPKGVIIAGNPARIIKG